MNRDDQICFGQYISGKGEEGQMNGDDEKTAVLIVSIGNGHTGSGMDVVSSIRTAIKRNFADYAVSAVWSRRQDADTVRSALDQALETGIRKLIVQPVYLMRGMEYQKLERQMKLYEGRFRQIVMGEPLLSDSGDYAAVCAAITERTEAFYRAGTAVCLVGHGSQAADGNIYLRMQQMLADAGYSHYYVGALKAGPSIDDVIKALKAAGSCQKIVLYPFMTAAGSHACRDIAGNGNGSWKRMLEREGYEVRCILEGLGQIPAVQDVYVAHVKKAAALLL